MIRIRPPVCALRACAAADGILRTEGTIIAAHGRHYEVTDAEGRRWQAVPRGKRSDYACGDRVTIESAGIDQARILTHIERSSLLYRSDQWKQKLIAANADQIIFVIAVAPAFSDELISRALAAAEHEGMRAIIVLNKTDLAAGVTAAQTQLAPFRTVDYPIIEISAQRNATPLRPWLTEHLSVLVGQSGMGKSTLINALLPEAAAATREISTALDSGKHTTTHASLYRLDSTAGIIDSPGLQEFGLAHLTFGEIEWAFREFRTALGQCQFHDCRHDAEPGCAIKSQVAAGTIALRRYQHFLAITRNTAARHKSP